MNERIEQMAWAEFAACKDVEPELFFPVSEVGLGALQVEVAKGYCLSCPVREICLAFALDEGLDHGVFGGKSAQERRALRATV